MTGVVGINFCLTLKDNQKKKKKKDNPTTHSGNISTSAIN